MPVVVQNELNMFRRLTWPYTEENEVDTVVIDLCGNEHWSYLGCPRVIYFFLNN